MSHQSSPRSRNKPVLAGSECAQFICWTRSHPVLCLKNNIARFVVGQLKGCGTARWIGSDNCDAIFLLAILPAV